MRHSRFLARAATAQAPAQAMDFIAHASDPDASHNCWAWRVGQDYRSSDDGEPAGTAGRPILAAIDGQGYDQVAVVVTRWFGSNRPPSPIFTSAFGSSAPEATKPRGR